VGRRVGVCSRIESCLEVSGLVDENVFRLEVAVDDVEGVQVLKRENDLRRIEARLRLAVNT